MKIKNYLGNEVELTLDRSRDDLLTEFGKKTVEDRYLMPGESYQDMFGRVAGYYADDSEMAQEVYDAISKHWFMPATPVLSNGGTDRGYPISCFLTTVEDSLESILETQSENGYLAAKGGGIGTYWGGVRSIGEKVGEPEEGLGTTSGAIPFIKMQDSQTLGISQGSLRRGSAAVYMDIHHPEIEEFIEIRKPSGDYNRKSLNIHHGVNVTDKFMEAVIAGEMFDLVSPKDGSVRKTVNARDLWMKLLETRVATGEPYIIFTDTVNRNRPQSYKDLGLRVKQSNLCAEIALTTGLDHLGKRRSAVCCLASVNAATVDQWYGNKRFVRNYLVFLDNVLTDFINKTEGKPGFEHARYAAMRERSIGGGWMGFHTYLQAKSIPMESNLAHYENIRIWKWLRKTADEVNVEVARERGACPDCAEAGIENRWTHMFAIAPTASISVICGTVSACHEPIPANVYNAKTLSGTFTVYNRQLVKRLGEYADIMTGHFVEDDEDVRVATRNLWLEDVWRQIKADKGSVQSLTWMTDHDKSVFKTWPEIDQAWLIQMMAERAKFVDQMASNNLACAPNVDKRELHMMHRSAWERGVPSLYYLRSDSVARVKALVHAGELPAPQQRHDVVLKDRGVAPVLAEPSRYDDCLACQ